MAGETIKSEAVCLDIRPWSRTSHIVSWLTPSGKVVTVVKGAVRPKSFFLGQYDLNYTCEILYYARAHGELHALRECVPLERRDRLREDFRALALAGYFRRLAAELAPVGPDAVEWFELLVSYLERMANSDDENLLSMLLGYELAGLRLLGLMPDISENGGLLRVRGERQLPISSSVAQCIRANGIADDHGTLLDTARVIGVFYSLHLDCASEVRRSVLGLISSKQ